MKLSKKIKRFMDKPRKNKILANAEHIVMKPGFLWKYYQLIFKIAYIIFGLMLILSFVYNSVWGEIFNGIALICIMLVHIKFNQFELLFKTQSAYDIYYRREKQ